jgi:hypothetical protein
VQFIVYFTSVYFKNPNSIRCAKIGQEQSFEVAIIIQPPRLHLIIIRDSRQWCCCNPPPLGVVAAVMIEETCQVFVCSVRRVRLCVLVMPLLSTFPTFLIILCCFLIAIASTHPHPKQVDCYLYVLAVAAKGALCISYNWSVGCSGNSFDVLTFLPSRSFFPFIF